MNALTLIRTFEQDGLIAPEKVGDFKRSAKKALKAERARKRSGELNPLYDPKSYA